jgi:hypothetical protein
MSEDRLNEIKARVALRHSNDEDHSPIDVHKTVDGFVTPEMLHQLCIECSDVDTVEALENGDLIDSADGVVHPCAAADVGWLVGEVELLRRQVDVMAKALQLDADNLKRALAKESASGGAA